MESGTNWTETERECSLNVLEIYKIYILKAIFAIKIHSDHSDKSKTYLGPDQKMSTNGITSLGLSIEILKL